MKMTIMMMVEGLRLLDEKMAGSENTKIVKKQKKREINIGQ